MSTSALSPPATSLTLSAAEINKLDELLSGDESKALDFVQELKRAGKLHHYGVFVCVYV
jgi:hypothetical protein